MKFIVSLFFIYILFRVISYLFIRYIAYKIKKAQPNNQNFEEQENTESQMKKKIFRQDEGEYTDFEEIDKK